MTTERDFPLAFCATRGASFALIAQFEGRDDGVEVSAAELEHWATLAATYSEAFHQALQRRLAQITHKPEGGSDAVRQG